MGEHNWSNGNGGNNHLTRRTIDRRQIWERLPGATFKPIPEHINGSSDGHGHHNHMNRNHRPNGMVSLDGENFVVIQETRRGVRVVEEVLGKVVKGGLSWSMTPKAELADALKGEHEYFEHAPGKPKEGRAYWVYVTIDEVEARRVKAEHNARLPARKEPGQVGSEAF